MTKVHRYIVCFTRTADSRTSAATMGLAGPHESGVGEANVNFFFLGLLTSGVGPFLIILGTDDRARIRLWYTK